MLIAPSRNFTIVFKGFWLDCSLKTVAGALRHAMLKKTKKGYGAGTATAQAQQKEIISKVGQLSKLNILLLLDEFEQK